jgi:hypothetical protein
VSSGFPIEAFGNDRGPEIAFTQQAAGNLDPQRLETEGGSNG